MPSLLRSWPLAGLAALAALGLAACSSDSTGSNGTPALSVAMADSLAEAVTVDADEMIMSSSFNAATGVGLAAPPSIPIAPPCTPTVSPLPVTNGDADVFPDSVRLSFACNWTVGVLSYALTGLVDVVDPTPVNTDFNVKGVFTDFRRSRTNTLLTRTWSATYNGSRQIAASPDTLGHTITNFQTDYSFANGRTARHLKNWHGKFTADVAGTIAEGSPLPDGTFDLSGSSTWTHGTDVFDLTLSTSPGLHYDANCTQAPKFDSGTTTIVVTRNGNSSTVTIQHLACGVFTVTRS
ncbi:MAG: hypothetical protein ACREMO_11185 [Gemmatimonadales bacterium]